MTTPVLLARQTDQIADHRAGNRRGELLDDVERFAIAWRRQQPASEGADIGLERGDAPGTKARR